MPRTVPGLAILAIGLSALAGAAESPALNKDKYPQATPQEALGSIVKALEEKDFAYWLTWLIRPQDKTRIIEKQGDLDKAVAHLKEKAEAMAERLGLMRQMLNENKPTEGIDEEDDEGPEVHWARYRAGRRTLLLEKQASGRWCMNTTVK